MPEPSSSPLSEQEFVTLLTRHQPDVWAFLLGLMPGNPDVADVLQKTNILLWNKRASFVSGTNFRAWALTVARYEMLAHLKYQKRHAGFTFDDDVLSKLADEGAEDTAETSARAAALESCMAKLRPQDRELIEYRYSRAGGLETLSRRCGRSVSSLSVSLFRIRTWLRRCVIGTLHSRGETL